MNPSQPIDDYAARQPRQRRDAVLASGALTTEQRVLLLERDYPDPDALRRLAGAIKQHTLENLDRYLEQAVSRLEESGATIHFASDADAARDAVLKILRQHQVKSIVKSKSMVTEEIHLNPFLEKHGITSLETDLGETHNLAAEKPQQSRLRDRTTDTTADT